MTYHPLVNLGGGLAGREGGGKGERVLWIHGYALDSTCWNELWERLPGWRHLGVDLPGHGSSLPLGAEEDLPTLARRLVDVARAHDVRHVVALSFGTIVALQAAIEAPSAFATLVLGSPLVGHGANDELFWKRYRELVNMYRMAGFGDYLRGRLMLVEPSPYEGLSSRPELRERTWDIVGRHPFWDLKDGAFLRLGDHPQSDVSLRRIESSVLLVVGGRGRAAGKRHAERLSRSLKDCRRLHVLGAGSQSLLERPQPAAAAIDAHLRGHGADPAGHAEAGGAA